MRAVVQRVTYGRVRVAAEIKGEIEHGLVVLLGAGRSDQGNDVQYMADKVANLRIFEDDEGKMNRSVMDVRGGVLAISQFTLYGDARKGRRPAFTSALAPDPARELYEQFLSALREQGISRVEAGVFGADMALDIENDGPVTILLDSHKLF